MVDCQNFCLCCRQHCFPYRRCSSWTSWSIVKRDENLRVEILFVRHGGHYAYERPSQPCKKACLLLYGNGCAPYSSLRELKFRTNNLLSPSEGKPHPWLHARLFLRMGCMHQKIRWESNSQSTSEKESVTCERKKAGRDSVAPPASSNFV